MIEKKLGKIESVNCGLGGYQEAMIGYGFILSGEGWEVATGWQGDWSIKRSEHAKWTESERINNLGERMMHLADLLNQAKKKDISDLKGIPVEATFEGFQLKEWRILKEVL